MCTILKLYSTVINIKPQNVPQIVKRNCDSNLKLKSHFRSIFVDIAGSFSETTADSYIHTVLHHITIQGNHIKIYTECSSTLKRFSMNLSMWLEQNEPASYQLVDRVTVGNVKFFQFIPTAVPESKHSQLFTKTENYFIIMC